MIGLNLNFQSRNPEFMQLTSPVEANVSHTQLDRISGHLQTVVDKGHLNGIQALLARRNAPFYFASFGWQDKEQNILLAEDTIFRIYSMTKPIISVATMMLFEEGKLQISDPVAEYLPEFQQLKVWVDDQTTADLQRPVLIRDLLTHTAGLTYGFDPDHPVDRLYKEARVLDRQVPPEQSLTRLCQIPLVFQPGTQWQYSIATDVLGHLLATIHGKSLGDVLQEQIFEPLGMPDTRFHVPAADLHRLGR